MAFCDEFCTREIVGFISGTCVGRCCVLFGAKKRTAGLTQQRVTAGWTENKVRGLSIEVRDIGSGRGESRLSAPRSEPDVRN